jgi:hypothetical protein
MRLQVAQFIEDLIRFQWLANLSTPNIEVERRRSDGGTDAITLSAYAKIPLFVKHHPEAVRREFAGFTSLQSGPQSFRAHLVPPLATRDDSYQMWVAPYVEGSALHALAMEPAQPKDQQWIIKLYRDVLANMKNLWISTRQDTATADLRDIYFHSRFVKRQNKLKKGFNTSNLDTLRLIVNDEECGTYSACVAAFSQRVTAAADTVPHACCTVHGDEHANNILVQRNPAYIDPTAWYLVDYVNSTKAGDWVFSVAKMLYWWKFYCVVELAKQDTKLLADLSAHWDIHDGALSLQYNRDALMKRVPPICALLEAEIMRMAAEVGKEFGEKKRVWEERLRLAQVAAIWGSAAYHFPKHSFAVPIMLGEAIRILNEPRTTAHPR